MYSDFELKIELVFMQNFKCYATPRFHKLVITLYINSLHSLNVVTCIIYTVHVHVYIIIGG